jgi:hypothetical protein
VSEKRDAWFQAFGVGRLVQVAVEGNRAHAEGGGLFPRVFLEPLEATK